MNGIAALRRSLQYTQKQVADSAGINRAAYSHIELGRKKPSVSVAIAIARTLHSTVEDLFGYGVVDPEANTNGAV
jgi:putative transcriptional regulator